MEGSPPPAGRRRRTQRERSEATRARLLDAALQCLVERGYAGTTTVAVAARARTSRGAQLHHFPTRASLVAAATRHLFASMTDDYRRRFAALAARRSRLRAALRLLWDLFTDPRHDAVLDLYIAARTDPALRAALAPVAAEHRHNVEELARQYFPQTARHPDFPATLSLILDAMMGMAVSRLLYGDAGIAADRQLALLARHAEALIAAAGRNGRQAAAGHPPVPPGKPAPARPAAGARRK